MSICVIWLFGWVVIVFKKNQIDTNLKVTDLVANGQKMKVSRNVLGSVLWVKVMLESKVCYSCNRLLLA